MVKNNRLAPILNQYKELALGPDQLSALEMGYIYEELLRRFSEQSGEEAGDHFTPREVIRLMVELLEIPIPDRHLSIYDPAGGTGGMLSVAKEHLLDRAATPEEKARVEKFVTVHGQELSPTNYAVCQADLLIKNDQQAKVILGNSLIPHDPHSKEPGDQWPEAEIPLQPHAEQSALRRHLGRQGRLRNRGAQAGNHPLSGRDAARERRRAAVSANHAGQDDPAREGRQPHRHHLQRLAALQWRLRFGRKRNPPLDSGKRLARRHRHAARPVFYNTGIFTYIWLLRNDKPASHRGRVMLIDARQQFEKEPKSFGNKRNRIDRRPPRMD